MSSGVEWCRLSETQIDKDIVTKNTDNNRDETIQKAACIFAVCNRLTASSYSLSRVFVQDIATRLFLNFFLFKMQQYCLCCHTPLLRHIARAQVYWYCPNCRERVPIRLDDSLRELQRESWDESLNELVGEAVVDAQALSDADRKS